MEEQIEKFGSNKKTRRYQNKRQRSNKKQHLKDMTTSYNKDLQEEIEDDWYEVFGEEEEWMKMKQ